MPLVWKLYVDLEDGDGTADDDLSAYVISVDFVQGRRSEDQSIADTGRCEIVLKNDDKRFSPRYASGPYYGNLVAGRAVVLKVICDGGSELAQFAGVVDKNGWKPAAGVVAGPFTCNLSIVDYMEQLQQSDVTLPLMENISPDLALEHILNTAFGGAKSTAKIEFLDAMSDGDTITFAVATGTYPWYTPDGLQVFTYTARTALTGAADEFKIETESDGTDITPDNFAAAINHDLGEGSGYGTGTERHPWFEVTSARSRVGLGVPGGLTWVALQDVASGYEMLSTSFIVTEHSISTDTIFVYVKKTGSPTGTATITFHMNERALSNSVQYGTVSGTFSEANAASGGGWLIVALDETVTFNIHQRYHAVMTTDRAASAVNYISWGEDAGTNNYSAQNISGTWTSLGTGLVWCIPGVANFEARFPGSKLNAYKCTSDNTDDLYWKGKGAIPQPPTFSGGTNGSMTTDLASDPNYLTFIGDAWRQGKTAARKAVYDTVASGIGLLWCAEDGTVTYKPANWELSQVIETPVITLDNEQNDTILKWGREIVNQVLVEYNERREVENSVIARAEGALFLPANKYRWWLDPPERKVARPNTFILPFVDGGTTGDSGTGAIIGAKDVQQPEAGIDYSLNTKADGTGRDRTYWAETLKGRRLRLAVEVLGGEVYVTAYSIVGWGELYILNLQVTGTALMRLNPQTIVWEDTDSITANGIKQQSLSLPSNTQYGVELAYSLAHFTIDRRTDDREYVEAVSFRGQTTVGSTKLYSVQIGNVIAVSEDQTAVASQRSIVIGRRVQWDKSRSEPILTWILAPINDQTWWVLDDATYGALPAQLAV